MGFYSIYKIIKDFFRKPLKTLIIIIITAVMICLFVKSSFCASPPIDNYENSVRFTNDYINTLSLSYDLTEQNALYLMDLILENNTNSSAVANINKFVQQCGSLGYFPYYVYGNGSTQVYIYKEANPHEFHVSPVVIPYTNVEVNVSSYKVTMYSDWSLSSQTMNVFYTGTSTNFLDVPDVNFWKRSTLFQEFLKKHYYKQDNSFDEEMKKVEQKLDSIAQNTYLTSETTKKLLDSTDLISEQQKEMIKAEISISESTKETAEELKKMNDFLHKQDVDNDSYDFNKDNPTNDITESGFDNIFQQFYDAFTSDQKKKINIPIPFANKNITFDSDFLYDALGHDSWIVDTMKVFWLFLVSLYVVKDVEKYIEKMKNGDIVSTTDTNIKTDML